MGWKTGRLVAGFPEVMVAGCWEVGVIVTDCLETRGAVAGFSEVMVAGCWEIGVIVTDCLETRGAVAGFSETGSKVEVVGNDGIVLGGA